MGAEHVIGAEDAPAPGRSGRLRRPTASIAAASLVLDAVAVISYTALCVVRAASGAPFSNRILSDPALLVPSALLLISGLPLWLIGLALTRPSSRGSVPGASHQRSNEARQMLDALRAFGPMYIAASAAAIGWSARKARQTQMALLLVAGAALVAVLASGLF